MKLDVTVDPKALKSVRDVMRRLSDGQLRAATAKAMNDTGFQLRKAMRNEMQRQFDRPTPYIVNSVLVKQAKPERLEAEVLPTYLGGKGIDPQKILAAQADGGPRSDKRSERALRRVGILPAGYQTAIPSTPFPGSDDGRGNIKGSFLVTLISYFQAFGEVGYRANMTARRKAKLADRTVYTSLETRQQRRLIRGVEFFVSFGKLRSGKTNHLAPGIWARSGTEGVKVQPVLMFVRSGVYRPRLDMDRVSREADAQNYFNRRLRYRIRQEAGI